MLRHTLTAGKKIFAKTLVNQIQKTTTADAAIISRTRQYSIATSGSSSDGTNDTSKPYMGEKLMTMDEVCKTMMKSLGLDARYNPIVKSRENLRNYEPKVEDLPPRTMKDSFTKAIIPLTTNIDLHNRYASITGNVRMGRLMEDMDMFAVWVIHNHVEIPNLPPGIPLPYTFVTILVDRVYFTDQYPEISDDIRLSGHVSWVGKSSIEITVWLEQMINGVSKKITRAFFLMAARNATNTGPLAVNPIVPGDDREKEILKRGEERRKRRQQLREQSIFKVKPTDSEEIQMYEIFKRTTPVNTMALNTRALPPNCRWMSESFAMNTIAAFPEHRNAHNKVFGGFLMRNAVEISWSTAYMFAKSRPRLLLISDITFDKPVGVNSFIQMTGYVVFTEVNFLQIMTIIDTIDAATGMKSTTNTFYSTYRAQDPVPEVLPVTYQEMIWYIQGKRKFQSALNVTE